MSLVTLIVGGQGQGKTTFVKSSAKDMKRVVVLDINNEYEELEKTGANRIVRNFRESLNDLKELNDITLIVEEATTFFSNRKYDENLQEMIIRKRHQKNNIFLIYHSLTDIPDYLLRISDYLILFKTKDNPSNIELKYKFYNDIRKAYYVVRNRKQKFEPFIIKLLK
jgi:dephospho-CoA kinase